MKILHNSYRDVGLGADALASFDSSAREHMADMNRLAELLYRNFKKIV